VHDLTSSHPENWYDLCAFEVPADDVTGMQTVSLCALGGKEWAGFDTYGQVAFSEVATYQGSCPNGSHKISATVQLDGVEGPVTRCIKFTPANDTGCAEPVHVDVLCCGNPATGIATFDVEDDVWTHLNATDEQHTVSATASLSLIGSRYYTDTILNLEGGDTDNNDVVDIDDVTWLIATFGEEMDGGTHPWDGTRDADFSTNGSVGTEDYTFITDNWLLSSDFVCDGSPVRTLGEMRTSISTATLPGWVADRADRNLDGVVNAEDVRQFEVAYRLGNRLSTKMEATTSRQRAKASSSRGR
jgi:hypothetical protein